MFSKIYILSWIRRLAFVWQRKPSRPITHPTVSVKSQMFVFCRSFISEVRGGFDVRCQSRSGTETRWGQSLSVYLNVFTSPWLSASSLRLLEIRVLQVDCWCRGASWFLNFLHQINKGDTGILGTKCWWFLPPRLMEVEDIKSDINLMMSMRIHVWTTCVSTVHVYLFKFLFQVKSVREIMRKLSRAGVARQIPREARWGVRAEVGRGRGKSVDYKTI